MSWTKVAFKVVIVLMGMLIVASSLLGGILNPFAASVDHYLGAQAPIAGAAFGAGLALAGFQPDQNLNWIRVSLLYVVMAVLWGVVSGIYFGSWPWLPIIVAIVYAALVIALHPARGQLVPRASGGTQGVKIA